MFIIFSIPKHSWQLIFTSQYFCYRNLNELGNLEMKTSGFFFGHITFEFQYQVFQDLNPVYSSPYFENHANIPNRGFF